jgi:hypothetical protein
MSDNISSVASALGRRAAGVPKKFSEEELAKRRAQMTQINATRTDRVSVVKGTLKRIVPGRLRRIP